jgi:hypothetical protein
VEAEAVVVFVVADQDDGGIALLAADADGALHELEGDAVAAAALGDGDGAEEGGAAALADFHRPDADDAGNAFRVDRDEAGVGDLGVAFAQALGRLGETARAENVVVQRLDGVRMLRRIGNDFVGGDGGRVFTGRRLRRRE